MRKILPILVVLFVAASAQATLTFTIDYSRDTNNFFNTQAKKDSFQAAADYLSGLVANTSLTAITSAGSNQYNPAILDPGTGGTTSFTNQSVAANTIVVYAGGRDLGGSVLGVGGTSGGTASGFSNFINTVSFRGNGTFSMTAVGSISFSTTFSFYFDTDFNTIEAGAMAGKADFFSVAVHELGHVLGIGTNTSWASLASGSHTFLGGASAAANGGSAPALTSDDGHWADGTTSKIFGTNTSQETAMDPTISLGTRKYFTTLDVAGLSDIGFTAVPEPADFALGAGAAGLIFCVWRRRRSAA